MVCGKEWLAKRFDPLGVESTAKIARDYTHGLRMPVEKAEPVQIEPPPPEPPPVFLPGAGLLLCGDWRICYLFDSLQCPPRLGELPILCLNIQLFHVANLRSCCLCMKTPIGPLNTGASSY